MNNEKLNPAHELFIEELQALLHKHCNPADHETTRQMGLFLAYESIKVIFYGTWWADTYRDEFIKKTKSLLRAIADRFFESLDAEKNQSS